MDTHARRNIIVQELLRRNDYMTADSLAYHVGVSSRTIRDDIKRLNQDYALSGVAIDSIPGKGFHIPVTDAEIWQDRLDGNEAAGAYSIPVTPQERVRYIAYTLLMSDTHLASDALSKRLFVSKTTIENDLLDVESLMMPYGLNLHRQSAYGTQIIGRESDKRHALVHLLIHPIHATEQDAHMHIDHEGIHVVDEALSQEVDDTFNLSGDAYTMIRIYLHIMGLRIKAEHGIEDMPQAMNDVSQEQWGRALRLCDAIGEHHALLVSRQEVGYLARLLMSSMPFKVPPVPKEKDDLWRQIAFKVQEINTAYKLNILDEDTINSLYALMYAMRQAAYVQPMSVDVIKRIKEQYPSAIEMAILMMRDLTPGPDYKDQHIAQIALIFATAVERQRQRKDQAMRRTVIVASSQVGAAQLLAAKLQRLIPSLDLVGVYPIYRIEDIRQSQPELILALDPFAEPMECPVVPCSPVLDRHDQLSIHRALQTLDKQSQIAGQLFHQLFHADLFIRDLEITQRDDVIRVLCNQMRDHGYADDGFVQRVFDRESITTTAIGNGVAIPHGISDESGNSVICVGILRKPIRWGQDKVQLVFLLNVHGIDPQHFKYIYERFFEIVSTRNKVKKMIHAADYETFIQEIDK